MRRNDNYLPVPGEEKNLDADFNAKARSSESIVRQYVTLYVKRDLFSFQTVRWIFGQYQKPPPLALFCHLCVTISDSAAGLWCVVQSLSFQYMQMFKIQQEVSCFVCSTHRHSQQYWPPVTRTQCLFSEFCIEFHVPFQSQNSTFQDHLFLYLFRMFDDSPEFMLSSQLVHPPWMQVKRKSPTCKNRN